MSGRLSPSTSSIARSHAAEDEVDRRQPAPLLERLEHHGGIDDAAAVPARAVVGPARLVADDRRAAAPHGGDVVDVAGEIGEGVVQRHRPLGMRDRHDRPVHDRDPVGDLLDVGHRRRQSDQQRVVGRGDDDLLPDGAAPLVAHVVALVEDDVLEVVEAAAVERVAQDLGRHHQHRRVRVHLHVAGEDADALLAVGAGEVAELLVAERLERRGVRDAAPRLERLLDGELGDQCLAGAGRRRDDHRLVVRDRADRLDLEVVQREWIARAEPLDGVHPVHGTTQASGGPYPSRGILRRGARLYSAVRGRRRITAMATGRALLTYEDYAALPDDGRRYEVHEGALSVTPSPGTVHQHIVGRLFRLLAEHVETRQLGVVWLSPLDVILSNTTIVQPDIVYVDPSRQAVVTRRAIEGAPTLAVEIISPSTPRIDRVTKLALYARHDVPYYWIVDPDARTLEAYESTGGAYRLVTRAAGAAAVALPPFPDLALVPGALWPAP
jgi:Uma2 family endonuclease